LVARHVTLVNLSKEVSDLSYKDVDDYRNYLNYLTDELSRLSISMKMYQRILRF